MLTAGNLLSLFKFLVKVSSMDGQVADSATQMLQWLTEAGFFRDHLKSFQRDQVKSFNERVAFVKSQRGKQFDFLHEELATEVTADLSDARIGLIQQINNMGNCYGTEKFLTLLRQVAGSNDTGFDAKVRFPMLASDELSPG